MIGSQFDHGTPEPAEVIDAGRMYEVPGATLPTGPFPFGIFDLAGAGVTGFGGSVQVPGLATFHVFAPILNLVGPPAGAEVWLTWGIYSGGAALDSGAAAFPVPDAATGALVRVTPPAGVLAPVGSFPDDDGAPGALGADLFLTMTRDAADPGDTWAPNALGCLGLVIGRDQ